MINKRSATSLKQCVYMGDDTRVQVDFLGVVILQFGTENLLKLQDVVYIPSIRRNLISVSILDRLGYSFLFGSRKVKLYQDSLLVDNGILCGSLYRLELSALPFFLLPLLSILLVAPNVLRLNEKSSTLWHKCLGYIS